MNQPTKRTKKQHIVPRFYLQRFVDDNGLVWSYDFGNRKIFPAKPVDTAIEQNFYSPLNEENKRFDELELWLSEVEAAAAPLFGALDGGELLRGEDREKFSVFLAAQYLRSPMMVTAQADLMGQMAHHLTRASVSNPIEFERDMDGFDKQSGITTSPGERREIRESLLDEGKFEINVLQHAGLPVITGVPDIAELIYQMNWLLVDVQSQHLILGDSPFVKVYDAQTYHPAYGDGGFHNKTLYLTFPLSPSRMLEMSWSGREVDGVIKVNKQRGRLYNRQRAHWAKRFLYANCSDSGIKKLGEKQILGTGRPRIVTSAITPKITVKRKL